MRELLETCRSVTKSDATLTWVDARFLLEQKVAPWTDLPAWIPSLEPGQGFWTIDVRLSRFSIAGREAPDGRYVRVEVEPGTKAHDFCAQSRIVEGVRLEIGGEVVIDNDAPAFPEIHPDTQIRVL